MHEEIIILELKINCESIVLVEVNAPSGDVETIIKEKFCDKLQSALLNKDKELVTFRDLNARDGGKRNSPQVNMGTKK